MADDLPDEDDYIPSTPTPGEIGRRGSSAKDLIIKFEKTQKSDSEGGARALDVSFATIDSEGRGHGLEERRKGGTTGERAVVHNERSATSSTLTEEEKKRRAFIPATLVSKNSRLVEERASARGRGALSPVDEFEARIAAKSNSLRPTAPANNGARGGAGTKSGGGATVDEFQRRILEKSAEAKRQPNAAGSSLNRLGDKSSASAKMDEFERRILAKTKSNNAAVASRSGSRSDSVTGEFERRIFEKTQSNSAAASKPGDASSSAKLDEFERRIMEKTKSNTGDKSSAAAEMDEFERRILAKTKSNNAAVASSSDSRSDSVTGEFERRIFEKTQSNSAAASGPGDTSSGAKLDEFERRILEKTKSNTSAAAASSGGATMDEFQKRISKKIASNDGANSTKGDANKLLEQRIMEKTKSNDAVAPSSDDAQLSRLEQRMLEKSRANAAAATRKKSSVGRTGPPWRRVNTDSEHDATADEPATTSTIPSKGRTGPPWRQTNPDLEKVSAADESASAERVTAGTIPSRGRTGPPWRQTNPDSEKVSAADESASAERVTASTIPSKGRTGPPWRRADPSSEKRTAEETKSNAASNASSNSSQAALDRLQQRITEKTRSGTAISSDPGEGEPADAINLTQKSDGTIGDSAIIGHGASLRSLDDVVDARGSFDERPKDDATNEQKKQKDGDDGQGRKRRAIQAVVKDATLTPAERSRRMQAIMAGRFDDLAAMIDEWAEAQDNAEEASATKEQEERKESDGDDGQGRKRRAIQAVVKDATLTPAERSRRMQAIMAGKFEELAAMVDERAEAQDATKAETEADETTAGPSAEEEDPAVRKRKAIQGVMKDTSLTPIERNKRIQAVIAGKWDEVESWAAAAPIDERAAAQDDAAESDETTEDPPAEEDPAVRKRKAIQSVMQDKSLTPIERNRRIQAVMAGRWDEVESWTSSGRRRSSIDERAAEQEAAGRRRSSKFNDAAPIDEWAAAQDDDAEDDSRDESRRGGVGHGSLPHPDEHFAPHLSQSPLLMEEPPRRRTSIDEWAAVRDADDADDADVEAPDIAVATAVEEEEEPDFIYNAIEWDPEAKPPLHRNRRFRAYTYLALLMIAIVVVLVVVYITSTTQQGVTRNIDVNYQAQPSLFPTSSPITNREASGVLEQLEAGVLYLRNETFMDMDRDDPRFLALDWILHHDMMQLVSDDVNLYQRFALAVLAYSLDSKAWYRCGDPGPKNSTDDQCYIFSKERNATVPDGDTTVWLSSTDECSWFGVTCSADGVVRQVDLNDNELIGVMPYELSALRFLQLLALPYNCIIGTIPSELGRLSNLLSLELHGNGLSGEMPRELYDLENLQLLSLADQYGGNRKCTGTDGNVVDINYRMGGLERGVRLEENLGLTGTLGSEIGVWRSMKGLHLFKNSLEGEISEEIGKLKYLRFLTLNDNFIGGSLPSSITKLRNLRELKFGDNFLISSLPSDLGQMTDLQIITANGNSMFGDIPDGLYELKKLFALRLDDTLMREAPWLAVSNEGITGSISTLIGGLEDLRYLFLNNNPMTGTIPTELGLCEKLEVLRVHRTNIQGTMPDEICSLRDKNLHSESGTGVLYSDCRPNNRTGDPFLMCDCCSDCCDHSTGVCVADD